MSSYLDKTGLTTVWAKIKTLFATKTELSAKADNNSVVHKSGNETITDTKTFTSKIVGNLTGNADTATEATHATSADTATEAIHATKAIQDSNGNQINTTYLPLSGGQMSGNIYRSTNDGYIIISGGDAWDSGGNITLCGKNNDTSAGKVSLQARSDAGVNMIEITPDVGVVPISYNAQGISLGTSSNKWKTINGFDVTGIGHIGNSVVDQSGDVKTYTRTNPNVSKYAHYCVAPDNGWVACREQNGNGTFQVCALGSDLNGEPTIISPHLKQFQFGSIPVRKGEYYAIISDNQSAAYTMRFVCNNG